MITPCGLPSTVQIEASGNLVSQWFETPSGDPIGAAPVTTLVQSALIDESVRAAFVSRLF
jgi:hypothetical protein